MVAVEWLFSGVSSVAAMIITFVALLVYLYSPYWGVRKVPGPPSVPLVGHLPLLAKYGPDVFSLLARHYGPIYRLVSEFNNVIVMLIFSNLIYIFL